MTFALVTGASRGIGKSIAQQLAQRGYHLLLVARSRDTLEEIRQQLQAKYAITVHILVADLSLSHSAQEVYNWACSLSVPISILVNNAGYGLGGSLEEADPLELAGMMQINMITPVELTRLFLGLLKRDTPSYILNVASTAAYQAVPYLNVYAASKTFLLSFSRALKHELRLTNISVTCVCPGPTDTDFNNRARLGEKPRQMARKFNMSPDVVAQVSLQAMLAKKAEVVPGFLNKLTRFFVGWLPKSIVETSARNIYD